MKSIRQRYFWNIVNFVAGFKKAIPKGDVETKPPKVSRLRIIVLGILVLFAINVVHAAYSELSWQYRPKNGRAFVDTLGYMGLSIPSECLSSRNPLLEPICLPDIPGGYCYHASCGKVAPTYIGKNCTIEVVRP